MSTVLITGSSGLVGSSCVRHFDALGWDVHGLDNNERESYFGVDGNTDKVLETMQRDCPKFKNHVLDIGDPDDVYGAGLLMDRIHPDLIIHAAAQPSHDWAAQNPIRDFYVNAVGTVGLLQEMREQASKAVFCYLSTNKVYGDAPNQLPVRELPSRYDYYFTKHSDLCCDSYGESSDYDDDDADTDLGINEKMRIDQSTHSLFGCSKLAADMYVQEYGRYFGMKTVAFRCGCLTGGAHAGTEQHGFLSYLVRCCREGRKYVIHGYKGKQVRDQLHAYDVARACEVFYENPRPGQVYNLGGGRENSVSVLEAIEMVQEATGKKLDWEYKDEPRRGDHQIWITDTSKFRSHFPNWAVTISLQQIINELACDLAVPVSAVLPGQACSASPECA